MAAVVRVESSGNPFAIGVVGASLERQPSNLDEAVATARHLEKLGMNYSVGIAQINKFNFRSQGIKDFESAFDLCTNLNAGASILGDCYKRANNDWGKAFSCYYSGNFSTGFAHGYVQRVMNRIQLLEVNPDVRGQLTSSRTLGGENQLITQKRSLPMSTEAFLKVSDSSFIF
jgi:type IV secretion system protein VirB1